MTLIVNIGELLHKLNWTPYSGFKIKIYKIEKLVGTSFVAIDSVPGTDTSARYFPAPCNHVERYRIEAVGYDSGEVSLSDTMGRQAIDTIPSDPPVLVSASVLDKFSAEIKFIGSDRPRLMIFVIQRSIDGIWGTVRSIISTIPGDSLQFIDTDVNTVQNHICYTVLTRDSCLNISPGDTVCLVDLSGNGLYLFPRNTTDMITF